MILSCVLLTLFATILFCLLNWCIYLGPKLTPTSIITSHYDRWLWRNILVSFIHSAFCGTGVILILLNEPQLFSNLITTQSSGAYTLAGISNGYFLYDIFLSLMNLNYPGRNEIIAHHIISMCCMSVVMLNFRYFGYCMSALIVEVNNVFIHLRHLMQMCGSDRRSGMYLAVARITIVSIIVFRILPLFWIIYCLQFDYTLIPIYHILLAVLSISSMFLVSFLVLYRILQEDFFADIKSHIKVLKCR